MKTKVRWYNDPQLVGTLLIFWLPVGLYGLYKSETIQSKWKRVTYIAVAIASILLVAMYLL